MQVEFERRVLGNGLKVLVHQDKNTQLVAFNILYDVGAKDEDPDKTGFAHLFEHLMFTGTKKFPDYDEELENAGGENNAFTNNDFTNYYISIPKDFVELAFELESDRMCNMNFTKSKVKTQQGVVIEEFKQRYLNQPYGDATLIMRPLCFKTHPYSWSTIGKKISHIEKITQDDIREFYSKYYTPNNAILVIAGDVDAEKMFLLAEKYFAHILAFPRPVRTYLPEAEQTKRREKRVERKVPSNAIYKTYHIVERMSPKFYVFDLISDILSNGKSTRFNVELIKKQRLFNELNAYVSADIEPGTFVISGHLNEGVSFEQADAAIDKEIEKLKIKLVGERELQKVRNKVETTLRFSNLKALDKAVNIAYFELMGGGENIESEISKYNSVRSEDIKDAVNEYLKASNSTTLYYAKEQ